MLFYDKYQKKRCWNRSCYNYFVRTKVVRTNIVRTNIFKRFLKSNVIINVKSTNCFIVQNVRDNIIRTIVVTNMLLYEISLEQC